jgi:hypothetical protein
MPNTEKQPDDITDELETLSASSETDAPSRETQNDEIVVDMGDDGDNENELSKDKTSEIDVEGEDAGTPPKSEESRFKRLKTWYLAHKKISIPLTILLVLALLLLIPVTRYAILSPFIKKDVAITITDSETHIPVSGVDVSLKGKTTKTDGQGKATLQHVSVGGGTLQATKKYFKDYSQKVTVTVTSMKPVVFSMQATGRQVPVKVTNKITGAAVAGATVKISDTEAVTDQNGAVTLVLPADKPTQQGSVHASGYNDLAITIDLNKPNVEDNSFKLTPTGKVYFLSKRTGKIDVVKTNLDGSNRQVVLAGTGQEEDTDTVLLASRDWKYLALQARRENGQTRLYLITTADDSVLEMDSGDATFNPVGWSEHAFVYTMARNNVQPWQAKANALKSYNADTKQGTTLGETNAEGINQNDFVYETFSSTYIMKDAVVYAKVWINSYTSAYRLAGKRSGLYQVKASSGGKQTIKDFDAASTSNISTVLAKPEELYVAVYDNGGKATYYEYANNALTTANDFNGNTFAQSYPTYLVSPLGSTVFWGEPRDGKNTLFTANLQLDKPKQLASGSDYTAYGWYTDDYLLLSKSGSELYIAPSSGFDTSKPPLKVTDYHKPARTFEGYGYGYGGQ